MSAVVVEEGLGEAWGNTAAILLCCEGLAGFCTPVGGAARGEMCVEGTVEKVGGGAGTCEDGAVEEGGRAVCGGIFEEGAVEKEGGGAMCGGTCEEGAVEKEGAG